MNNQYDTEISEAIKYFWNARDGGKGVLGGKTLDGFVELIANTIKQTELHNVEILTGKNTSQLPGFFRPHKSWDVVVVSNGELVAAIELKSQVGSIGNNFNNRTEEVLGSGIDLSTAIEEQAFSQSSEIFTGYMIVVEDSLQSKKEPYINMSHFPVMKGFLKDEEERDNCYSKNSTGTYPRAVGISYMDRYDLLCKRLVQKKLYTAAAVIESDPEQSNIGQFSCVSNQTSIQAFLTKLVNHCNLVSQFR